MVVICFGIYISSTLCQEDDSEDVTAVYIVTLKEAQAATHYYDELRRVNHSSKHGAYGRLNVHKRRYFIFIFLFHISFLISRFY